MKPANLIKRLSIWLNGLSCAALAGLMLLITANVILRTVFKSPLLGTYDLTGFFTAIVIGCGLAFCSLENGHIEIGIFVDKLRGRSRRSIQAAGKIVSCLVLFVYTYALAALALRLMQAGELSVTTRTPLFPFVLILSGCFALFAATVFLQVLADLGGNRT
jgi:TRAP-type C4-dicarboxylate transport system permease small subunit